MTDYKNKYQVISVESRKGGVGKTMASLLMSDVICNHSVQKKRKTKVIFIDMDICGTSLKYLDKTDEYNHIEFLDLNLVTMFEDFLAGKDIPIAKCNFKNKNIMLIHSEIPDTGTGANHPIYTPQVLFDELHIVWFMEFLQKLFDKYSTRYEDEYNIAFILDNPPGFTELVPAVEDLLVELGPEIGKTLFVSSLDHQDLESTMKAMKALFLKYQRANRAATLCHHLKMAAEDGTSAVEDQFDRVLFDKLLNNELEPDNFYQNTTFFSKSGGNHLNSPEKFIDVIINKVPVQLMQDDFLKENLVLEKLKSSINDFEKYFPGFDERILENCIEYNEKLSLLHMLFNFKDSKVAISEL